MGGIICEEKGQKREDIDEGNVACFGQQRKQKTYEKKRKEKKRKEIRLS